MLLDSDDFNWFQSQIPSHSQTYLPLSSPPHSLNRLAGAPACGASFISSIAWVVVTIQAPKSEDKQFAPRSGVMP